MDTLFLCNTKTLKEKINTKVFAGDNHITKINVQLPDNLGGYPKKDCEYNLRAIIPEGNLSYIINPSQPYFYITNDITEKAQTVKLMMIITHEGNVIGRTNTVDLIVNEPAEAPDPPLTPREEFDEVIAEQRAEIAEQAETISEQATEIEAKDGQISDLNGQVTELEAENAEQAQTITRQNTTIDELNRRVPPLQQLDPINPSGIQQTYNPESPNIGFPQVIVNPVTAEGINFHPEYYKEGEECVGKVGTYNPLPEGSEGGIYFDNYDDSGFPTTLIYYNYYTGSNDAISFPSYDMRSFKSHIKEIIFRNCPQITNYPTDQELYYYANLEKYIFPENTQTINTHFYESGYVLKTVWLPNTLTSIRDFLFEHCRNLEFVILENGFNCNNLKLNVSTLYSVETIVSWLEALADRTGETAYTLTIGTTNLNKLTAEQKAIATNKNWNLA